MNIQKILDYLKNPQVQRNILLIGFFIVAILLFRTCGRTSTDDQITKLEQNLAYYKDTLKVERNKVGELQYSRDVLAATNKNLEDLNANLKTEVDKQKGRVFYISQINAELRDSIKVLTNHVNPDGSGGGITVVENKLDSSYTIKFNYAKNYDVDNYRKFNGDTYFKIKQNILDTNSIKMTIKEDVLAFSLYTGLEEDKDTKNLKIFVRSNNPTFSVKKLDGALIDPQKSDLIKSYFKVKRWHVGPSAGIGISSDFKPVFFVGGTVTYSIFSF